MGGSIRAYSFCKYLTKLGHEVFLVTKKQSEKDLKDFPIPKNCHITRTTGKMLSFIFPGAGYVPFFLFNSPVLNKKNKIDLIHGSSPTIGSALTAFLLKKITKKPFVMGIRDPWMRSVELDKNIYSFARINPKKGLGKIKNLLEKKLVFAADAIVVTNPAIIDETILLHPGLNRKKFFTVWNAADLDDFKNVKTKKEKKFTIVYSGALYKSRVVDSLIKAMQFVDAQLIITGSGPQKEVQYFKKLLKKKNLEKKVLMKGIVSNKKLYSTWLSADLLFSGLKPITVNKYLMPSKVFNYMAAGKPILCTGCENGDLDKVLKKYNCGKMIYSDKPEQIAKAINHFKKNKNLMKKFAKNARKAVEQKFNRKQQAMELVKAYKFALKKPNSED